MDFQWAIQRLKENKRVRRVIWPIETVKAGTVLDVGDGETETIKADRTRTWHLFMTEEYLEPKNAAFWQNGIVNGWGGSIGGADDDDPVRDGMSYSPTAEDQAATDWELHDG
jgi:hypothetical protein